MRGKEERIRARRRRRRRRRRKGHKGPKSDCGRGEARPAIFCPTRGSSDDLVGQLRKRVAALELQIEELQIEDSIRRLDAF